MPNILVLGAYGQIARVAIGPFLDQTDAKLTLYLRNAGRLSQIGQTNRVRVLEGDVLDLNTLQAAMVGQDVVYANLAALRTAVGERLEVKREVGRGGMATVYLAQDLRHNRPVALKVLHPHLAQSLGPDRRRH